MTDITRMMAAALDPTAGDPFDDVEWEEVAEFEAGRLKLSQDVNGSIDLTMRVPPIFRHQVYGATDYAGVRMRVRIEVPKGVVL